MANTQNWKTPATIIGILGFLLAAIAFGYQYQKDKRDSEINRQNNLDKYYECLRRKNSIPDLIRTYEKESSRLESRIQVLRTSALNNENAQTRPGIKGDIDLLNKLKNSAIEFRREANSLEQEVKSKKEKIDNLKSELAGLNCKL